MIYTLISSSSGVVIDTQTIAGLFGIPHDKYLVIDGITFSADGADNVVLVFDREIALTDAIIDTVNPNNNHSMIRLDVGVAQVAQQVLFKTGIEVFDRIVIKPAAQTWVITFDYHLEEGSLNWQQETVETIGAIKKLDARESRTAGNPYYQVGPFKKVGE